MKIWITGSQGVLGRAVVEEAQAAGYEVHATSHGGCNIDDSWQVAQCFMQHKPDVIINCAGRVPGSGTELEMIFSNTIGPRILATFCEANRVRLIHVSTDCVFSGVPDRHWPGRRYEIDDEKAPVDVYGRSKLLGESTGEYITVVRTSFIGYGERGLLAWLLQQEGEIEGWQNAMWTGTTARVVARNLVALAEVPVKGIFHLASQEKVSKYWLLKKLAELLELPIKVKPVQQPYIDRALEPSPGFEVPSLERALTELVKEVTIPRVGIIV